MGAGPIGLLVLAVVRAHGARRAVVTDVWLDDAAAAFADAASGEHVKVLITGG